MIALAILSFLPSLFAGFFFGLRGVLTMFVVEIVLVLAGFRFFVDANTGMEGLALMIWCAIIIVENAGVAYLIGRSGPATQE